MDQELNPQTPQDKGSVNEKVFDITPDLSISPVTDENKVQTPKTIIPPGVNRPTVNQPKLILERKASNTVLNTDKTPQIKENNKFPEKALRTYQSDVAEFMSHKKTSMTSIAMAENEKRQKDKTIGNIPIEPKENKQTDKKLFLLLISLILLAFGAFTAYYFYSRSALAPRNISIPQTQTEVSLVPSNSRTAISTDNMTPNQILTAIKAEITKPQTPKTLKEIRLTENRNGQTIQVSAARALALMDIAPPDILVRSLDQNWMLGEYSNENGDKDVFVIVIHNFFQNAFAGMLAWENVMADDLKQYLNYPKSTISNQSDNLSRGSETVTVVTSNATSSKIVVENASSSNIYTQTNPAQYYFSAKGHFTDSIIKNKDVREFRTDSNYTLFLYSFVGKNKLVLTSNESVLIEILSRLEQQAFLR